VLSDCRDDERVDRLAQLARLLQDVARHTARLGHEAGRDEPLRQVAR
jgi:hypothetical protein